MADEARDMISVLVRDHDEIKGLFRQIESASDGEARRRYADQVTAELVRHAVAEEMDRLGGKLGTAMRTTRRHPVGTRR